MTTPTENANVRISPEFEEQLVQMSIECATQLFNIATIRPRFLLVREISTMVLDRLSKSGNNDDQHAMDDVVGGMLARIALARMIEDGRLGIMSADNGHDGTSTIYLVSAGTVLKKKSQDPNTTLFDMTKKPEAPQGEIRDPALLKKYLQSGAELIQEGRDFSTHRTYQLAYGLHWRVPVSRDLGDALVRLHMVKEDSRSDQEGSEIPRYVMRWSEQ